MKYTNDLKTTTYHKLTQEEIESLDSPISTFFEFINSPISTTFFEFIIKTFSQRKLLMCIVSQVKGHRLKCKS